MSTRQLRLFPPSRPLLERFGREFFREVPAGPGVYIMSSEMNRVLYVGQSRRLRARLGSYRYVHPDRAPGKLVRLVHAVDRIVWQECESAAAALLRENELLRRYRPKYNTLKIYPKAYCFVALRVAGDQLVMGLTTDEAFEGQLYGAFKRRAVAGFSALLRLLWAALHQPCSPYDFPGQLLRSKPPRIYSINLEPNRSLIPPPQWLAALLAFLEGVSANLIDLLAAALPSSGRISCFQQALHTVDLENLTDFFQYGPKRNRDLKERHHLQSTLIPQETLDDLLVLNQPAVAVRSRSG